MIFFEAGESTHTQWITLFESLDDDEYDGSMGDQDDEQPRILCVFDIYKERPASQSSNYQSSASERRKMKREQNMS
jgi:hypothetical protein